MFILDNAKIKLAVDLEGGCIRSAVIGGREWIAEGMPLFKVGLRDRSGANVSVDAFGARSCELTENGAVYTGFENADLEVEVFLTEKNCEVEWRIRVTPKTYGLCAEWVDFPLVALPKLAENGGGGEILFPYNEGALVRDMDAREGSPFNHKESVYPSHGSYAVFPNMVCSQMLAYLWGDCGLYIGAHDPARGVKGIDFYPVDSGVAMQIRLFCGVDFGETYAPDFPVVWSVVGGNWESSAERYRVWFESALPEGVKKVAENPRLPEWYSDSPLVLTYPVRGTHDKDEMKPNRMFPYVNALPAVERIKKVTGSRIMALLMHWEGTAPWAPPYVWPPYGGVEAFGEFRDRLHENGDLLGVYCSGFGYTLKSNLDDYERTDECRERGLEAAMCESPEGKVEISRICTSQRSGYDICPASRMGRELLLEAYSPLFEGGADYAQILDQNHGGGQYFCYGRDHGHPPVPGAWMTDNMQKMLATWQDSAPNMLFGCESAAAEAFIGNLLLSDNRFELNYYIGRPVPLYAYIYHEYLRNFMGNQVSCPIDDNCDDGLAYRIAYAFSVGDCLTLILNQDGGIMPRWGKVVQEKPTDSERMIRLVAVLCEFYRERGRDYLLDGRMVAPKPVECESVTFPRRKSERTLTLPSLLTSAWERADGSRVQILVNPFLHDVTCRVDGRELTVPAESVTEIEIG